MKNLIVVLLLFFITLTSFKKEQQEEGQELKGLVVILDPGHGGLDNGAHGYFGQDKTKIIESVYCYDIALRLESLLIKKGAIVYKTINNLQIKPINYEYNDFIKRDTNSVFSYDGTRAVSGLIGLSKRVEYANNKLLIYPDSKIVYISIHFDKLPNTIYGTRIIIGNSSTKLANCLKDEFKKENFLTNHKFSILYNGDKTKGIKNLIVLRNTNKIKEKVLIELGNFNHENDLNRLVDCQGRDEYANIICKSLVVFMNNE
ncbi:MAG: N-acetylmuramoyl-L-alanine amidase [Candidatus Pacebacteria bacterium]|nr:N-acetylmuramoyl-L-alanine amidase [Candidatus Paceibacterota bacterium]